MPNCPKCGEPLTEIRYPSNSMLNRDQWESVRAGDYFCTCHNNNRGKEPYAYFWKKELAPVAPSRSAAPEPICPCRISEGRVYTHHIPSCEFGYGASAAPPSEREMWRVGSTVPINIYEGDRPICQCHTVADAKLIVEAVNAARAAVPQAAPQTPDRAEAIKTLVDDWNDGVLDAPILLDQAYEFGFKAGAAAVPAPGTTRRGE